jgi:glycosyltransferase involved in cell wall biosynthesis
VRLIRAYRRVAASGFPHALVLAGALGWHHEALMREIALKGPGDIVMTGELPEADLDALYRGAAAFVYPSLYEGFGLPVVEAMARSVPTIASNTSSVPEVAGDAALGVNPRSVREIAQAIEQVLTDVGLAERLAARGRAQAERFSWEETARLTLQVYEQVAGAK